MDFQATISECTRASDEERARFPEILGQVSAVAVERYHADLVRSVKTYYTSNGVSGETPAAPVGEAFASSFSATGVEPAVRASQSGAIKYREFCSRITAAGCVGYFVTLAGRRAVYHGRTVDTHVEHYPAAR